MYLSSWIVIVIILIIIIIVIVCVCVYVGQCKSKKFQGVDFFDL